MIGKRPSLEELRESLKALRERPAHLPWRITEDGQDLTPEMMAQVEKANFDGCLAEMMFAHGLRFENVPIQPSDEWLAATLTAGLCGHMEAAVSDVEGWVSRRDNDDEWRDTAHRLATMLGEVAKQMGLTDDPDHVDVSNAHAWKERILAKLAGQADPPPRPGFTRCARCGLEFVEGDRQGISHKQLIAGVCIPCNAKDVGLTTGEFVRRMTYQPPCDHSMRRPVAGGNPGETYCHECGDRDAGVVSLK